MYTLRAWWWLTASMLVRLLRYGAIIRSLVFPAGLVGLTLVLTLAVLSLTKVDPVIAVSADLFSQELQEAMDKEGLEVRVTSTPELDVRAGRAAGGSDGTFYWATGMTRDAALGESILRRVRGASWRYAVPKPSDVTDISHFGALMLKLLSGIFSLYGVVFGAAMIARDREDGTLEVDCSLPIPRWLHGASRLSAGCILLSVFLTVSAMVVLSLVGIDHWMRGLSHGIAASMASLGIGLASVGKAKLKSGFGTALATGLTATTALYGVGYVAPAIGQYLPLSSLLTDGPVVSPLVGACILLVVANLYFTRAGLKS